MARDEDGNILTTIVFQKNMDALTAVDENGKRKYRYIINQGSSRSSKTTSLNQIIHWYVTTKEKKRITVWRDTAVNCRDTVEEDFIDMLADNDLTETLHQNKSRHTHRHHTSVIEFNGTDSTKKVHGKTQSVAWFNEANEISGEVFDQINMRTSDVIFIDWNPSEDIEWIDSLLNDPRAIVIHSTFLDNPFCPEESRITIMGYEPWLPGSYTVEGGIVLYKGKPITENNVPPPHPVNIDRKTADKYNWEVYGLGIKAKKAGIIYNWEECEEIPEGAKYLGIGLDFGYSNDPSAAVHLYKYNKAIYVDEILYETGLINIKNDRLPDPSIELRFEEAGIGKEVEIVCDSSEPKSRREMVGAGWYVIPVKKKGEVGDSIKVLQGQKVYYTKRSTNIRKERRLYAWKIDPRTGLPSNKPEDKNNHLMDAIRYGYMYFFR